MSSGGSSTPSSTTTTTALPSYAQPYAQQILSTASNLSNQETPQYTGQTYAGLTDTQNQAISGINNLANNGGYTGQVAGSTLATANNGGNNMGNVSNQYIGQNVQASQNPFATTTNPYLSQELQLANTATSTAYQNAAGQTNAQFAAGGAFGGSAMNTATQANQTALANGLANNSANIYNNAYNTAANAAGQQASLNTNTALQNQANNLNYTSQDNTLNSSNYNTAQSRALQAQQLASGYDANTLNALNAQMAAGTTQQTANQNADNAAYQTWYNQAMSPYAQAGILQSGLAAALGAGSQGIASSSQTAGSGNPYVTGLGVGTSTVGLLNGLKSLAS